MLYFLPFSRQKSSHGQVCRSSSRVHCYAIFLCYRLRACNRAVNSSPGSVFNFPIFYFRVYNTLHTPLLLQLEREDKWFCEGVNTFNYKLRKRNSITYRYRTNFLTFRAVNEGRIMRSPVNIFYVELLAIRAIHIRPAVRFPVAPGADKKVITMFHFLAETA